MSILGFSSAQTFESTHMDEIKKNFKYKMNVLMKMPGKNSKYKLTERKLESRRVELRKINEAMQFLQKKRSKKEKIMQDWKKEKQQIILISKTIDALNIDEGNNYSIFSELQLVPFFPELQLAKKRYTRL